MTALLERDVFTYTHVWDSIDSSFVEEVYYNERTRELLVCLEDTENGDDPEWYAYKDVPKAVVLNWMENEESKGRFYNLSIKPAYGPGDHLVDEPYHMEKVAPLPVTLSTNDALAYTLNDQATDDEDDSYDEDGSEEPLVYQVSWTWNGNAMPDHVVQAADDDAAVRHLLTALRTLAAGSSDGVFKITGVYREMDITI